MLSSSSILALCLVVGLVQATAYTLQDDYSNDFFDRFDFYTGADPTEGWVDYLTYDNATASGLIKSTNPPKWGVDDNNVIDPSNSAGRPSVRLTSKTTYNHGLFILDLAHMPGSACGSWPAFWSFSQTANWPAGGEIDIIEFVNNHNTDQMALHTSDGCSINGDSSTMTGTLLSSVCDASKGNGCAVNNTALDSAGSGFDNIGGGVYAMEWISDLIQVWFFPRGSVPAGITNGTPDTSYFGEPNALFEGSCDIDSHFFDHALIFDLTFCGTWAGVTYQDDGCPMKSGEGSSASCIAYVGENPSAFKNSYWEVNSLKVYSMVTDASLASASTTSLVARSGSSSSSSSSSAVATHSASSTSPTTTGYSHGHHGPPSRRHAHAGRSNW